MKFERYEIQETQNGEKIYFFLKNLGYSERNISQLRKIGALQVNGENANMRTILKTGDILSVQQICKKRTEIAESEGELKILFEDADFLVVNKPAMLACTPTRSHYAENLGGQICRHLKTDENFVLRILNRLDLETSGIVVVAKNTLACRTKVDKEYHALVEGEIEKSFTINLPIETLKDADGRNIRKRVVSQNGKNAVTHVRLLHTFHKTPSQTYSLASIKLETGRTHQIRVHLSHLRHPLLGDSIYNRKDELQNEPFPTNNSEENVSKISSNQETASNDENIITKSAPKDVRDSTEIAKNESHPLSAQHTMLILKKITFSHFRTKETLSFEVPYPQDWKPFLN